MHLHTHEGRETLCRPGWAGSRTGPVWLATGAGLAGASSLLLLVGLSDLGIVLGLPPWSAHLLSGAVGLAGAAAAWRGGLRRSPPAGLTPAQALSQLRRDLDLVPAAAPDQRGPGAGRNAGALR